MFALEGWPRQVCHPTPGALGLGLAAAFWMEDTGGQQGTWVNMGDASLASTLPCHGLSDYRCVGHLLIQVWSFLMQPSCGHPPSIPHHGCSLVEFFFGTFQQLHYKNSTLPLTVVPRVIANA